ncbi:MAG: hypothetical protein IJ229_10390 [Clostridia bacterium]|nr:hypothetical protein [Clostridia bacterium]
METMEMHLLEGRKVLSYTTFGSYWTKEQAIRTEAFEVRSARGESVPVQTEIAARWPDGSVKWARHTADARRMGDRVTVFPSEKEEQEGLRIAEHDEDWEINAGRLTLHVPRPGTSCLARKITWEGEERVDAVAPVFRLVRVDGDTTHTYRDDVCITEVDFEEQGPLACTVRYAGWYVASEERMPFVIRMTLFHDTEDIRFVHTFLFHGEEARDFLGGMGLRFFTRLKGEAYNRHVKLMTDAGVFHEPAALMESRIPRTGPGMKEKQMRGSMLAFVPGTDGEEVARTVSADVPVWNRYTLTQLTCRSFRIRKQTKPNMCQITAFEGVHAPGAMAVCGETGGILVGMRDFWQRYPSSLEVEGLGAENTACTAWFYAPEAEPYDFRHYDDRAYPRTNYEGFDFVGASADGIATTRECTLKVCTSLPEDEALNAFTQAVQKSAVYVATPEAYHARGAFGVWSLPEKNSQTGRMLENMIDSAVAWYQGQIKQRSWYGLFDYGDFMHSYDPVRHTWKYDIGGCAWQNTELVPTYWLWYQFLRTGREDVFSLAEAMSRHASETDLYHFGPMKGIGSRHNVRHWGCSCKEPRVSMAGHHRPMFYLTGDRRIGEVLSEVADAADSLGNLRYYVDNADGKLHARTGPDWSSFVSDWMTAYERTLDETYREKILRGIEGISRAPMRLGSGPSFAFDPATGEMTYAGEYTRDIHLTLCMGAVQVWIETAGMLDNALLRDMLIAYGRDYLMTDEERTAVYGALVEGKTYPMNYVAAALAAYAAKKTGDSELAGRAWDTLLMTCPGRYRQEGLVGEVFAVRENGEALDELPWVSTNYISQWCVNVIVALELIGDSLPALEEAERLMDKQVDVAK